MKPLSLNLSEPLHGTILAIDDNPETLSMISTIITGHLPGATVLKESDSLSAFTRIVQEQPDVVLLDVSMPTVDGYEICRQLKGHPSLGHTPVLLVSGVMINSAHRTRGLECGADGYLCKPFQNQELVAQVKALLRIKKYQDQLLAQQQLLQTKVSSQAKNLLEREEQLHTLFQNSPDAIFIEDLNGQILDVNPAACELHGMSRNQLVGAMAMDLIPDEHQTRAELCQLKLASGLVDRIEGYSRHQDGSAIPVEIRASHAHAAGQPVLQLHVRDIRARRQAEADMKASEEKFSLIFQQSNDAVFLHRPNGEIVDANNKALDVLGYTREELLAMEIEALHPQGAQPTGTYSNPIDKDNERHYQIDFLRKNGTTFPAEVSASSITLGTDELIISVVRNITERQRADDLKLKTTMRLRSIVESADELIRYHDVDTIYRRAVECAREHLGLERCSIFVLGDNHVQGTYGTDLNGKTTIEHENIMPRKGFWDLCFKPLTPHEAPCRVTYKELGSWENGEVNPLQPDWLAITPLVQPGEQHSAVFLNDSGISGDDFDLKKQQLLAVYCSLVGNIISAKQTQEKLFQAERQHRTLVEQLPAVTYVVNMEDGGNTQYISPQLEAMFGYSREEWQSRPDFWIEKLHPEDKERIIKEVRLANLKGQSFFLEYRVLAADGRVVWVRNLATYHFDEQNNPIHIHGVMFDISERKEALQREQDLQSRLSRARRMESLGLLAGGVAHDLNNILGPLVAYPDMILEQLPEDSLIRQDVKEISTSANRAADVIQDLLTLARRGNYQLEPVSLNQMLFNHFGTVDFQNLRTQYENVVINTNIDEDLPPIQGSTSHIERVISNILTNAFEAIQGKGHITLSTRVTDLTKPFGSYTAINVGSYIELLIEDTGEGISEEDRERIFEPFYSKRKMGRSGTGLGLAVVYGIIRDLNGYVDVKSKEGEGTSFHIYLPVTQQQLAPQETTSKPQGGCEKILVVDDVKEQREIAARILSNLGYQVKTAVNGREALKYVKKNFPDLIVLDMIMDDGFDGLDTYREVLKLHPEQRCVIASGYAETDRVREAKDLGAGTYVKKPYTMDAIGLAVRLELDRKAG